MALTVEALPAAHGDALLVSWGRRTGTTRMLVDGGPWTTYRTLVARLEALPAPRRIDVLVVTHIDGDHIEGVIRLLRDRRALGLSIGDVWFNGWPQLQALAPPDLLGPGQGEMLGALLDRGSLPWNAVTDGAAVALAAGDEPVTLPLPGGAAATLVGPRRGDLADLLRTWRSVLAEDGWEPGDENRAIEELEQRRSLRPIRDVLGEETVDASIANRTSIGFVLEADGARVLLTGDAHGDTLAAAAPLAARQLDGDDVLAVDLVKLPHHGSAANVTDEFLASLRSPRFLFSTNGSRYRHPGPTAVRRVLSSSSALSVEPELVFNYRSSTTEPWDRAERRRTSYTTRYPEAAHEGVVVTL